TTPFNWDGTSNIVINLCAGVGATNSTTVAAYTPSPALTGMCQNTGLCTVTIGTTVATKPTMRLVGSTGGLATFVWNPGNLSGTSINACPNSTTTYTVTGTNY